MEQMHLGIVMRGTGALAAANAGVLRLLRERGIGVYAVCGMHFGAWTAMQVACGYGVQEMEEALLRAASAGRRLLGAQHSSRALLSGARAWMSDGAPLQRLMRLEMGERLLALCAPRAIVPCRLAATGRRVVFSTCAYAQGRDVQLTQQATVGFAARAALACPPVISPMSWSGSWLLPEADTAFAADQLLRIGADRVLIVDPRPAPSRRLDAMELACAAGGWDVDAAEGKECGILRVTMPAHWGALDFARMRDAAQIGYEAASVQMDALLHQLGMAQGRVLPFRARALAVSPR